MAQEQGTIKFYNENNKYGFITTAEKQDLFFHISKVLNKDEMTHMAKDKKCTYELIEGKRGTEAANVALMY